LIALIVLYSLLQSYTSISTLYFLAEMPRRKKLALITLGCPKNIVDSEVLLKQLEGNNYEIIDTSDGSDVLIINTCGFIESAKEESIDTIMRAVRLKEEGRIGKLVVMGCLSERYADDLSKEIPEVDNFIGANKLREVLREIGADWKNELLGERTLTTPPHYAYLKISEGCDRPCSFCAIPKIKGSHRSIPLEQLQLEAIRLAEKGVKELILIAQDTTYYGVDIYGKRELSKLLTNLAGLNSIEWIRLMYAYPLGFPDDVIDVMANNSKMCKYIDIPLQHISDGILTSMTRGVSSDEIRKLIYKLREKVPDMALRTTFIVGYPTEGDEEFQELLRFVQDVRFERAGVFTYSQEEGTEAFKLGDPVPALVKEERYTELMELQEGIALQNNRSLIGKRIRVLIDSTEGTRAIGRTEYDAPEIDNDVVVNDALGAKAGYFYAVDIERADAYDIEGILYGGPGTMNGD
jgi:ribosomal protein S12 methylthiotransferase